MAVFCSFITIIIIIIIIIITAIELSLCGSSPYTSTDKTNKNIHINETIQKTQGKTDRPAHCVK